MSFDDLHGAVLRWADARGILLHSDPKTQLLKTMSELGELADAVIKGNEAETKDGLGDVMVTLIIVSDMFGYNLTNCLRSAYNEIKDRKGYLNSEGVFIKEE